MFNCIITIGGHDEQLLGILGDQLASIADVLAGEEAETIDYRVEED